MPGKSTHILLVEDNPGDARLVREMLAEAGDGSFAVDWVSSLSEALEHLARGGIDLVLLDLGLPDSRGLDTFLRAYEQASHLPFLVLTGHADETLGSTAVRQGAQDYLPKGEVTGSLLQRSIRYAIERKRSEIALETERKKIFSVLNNLPAFVYLKEEDFAVRFANQRFIEIFGEPGNQACYQIIRGRSEPCEGCHSIEVLKTKVPQKFEFTTPVDARTYEVYNYPFCVDDRLLVLTLGIDITERKQMEKALWRQREEQKIILDSVPAMIFFKDMENRFVRINKTLAEALGSTVEDVEGKTVLELFPGHAEDYWKDDLDVVTSGNPKRNIIEPFITTNSSRWVQTDKIPYRDEEGKIIGIIGFAVDITERQQAEATLRESEKKLRLLADQLLTAQEDERKRISGELHDELGHALLTLKLDLRSIEKQLLPEQQVLSEEVESVLKYIDEVIKNVRRLYLGLSPGDLEDLGLTAALKSLIDEFSQHNQEITWSIDLGDIDGLFPLEFQTNIYRIFQEILTNIGKHAAPTHVSIVIRKTNKGMLFKVEDNGKGFNHTNVLNGSYSQGLGLIVMEERVRIMGGSFNINSQENQGTNINFTIQIS